MTSANSLPSKAIVAFVLFAASMPNLARACPMCFSGGNQNQDAFLYGSLFMMVVPVVALGGLGFWVYRRIRAVESSPDVLADSGRQGMSTGQRGDTGTVLPMVSRH